MKKLLFLLGITGLILSSCNGSYTIAKRKYNKGFYVNVNHGNKTNAVAKENSKTTKTMPKKEEVLVEKVVAKTISKAPEKTTEVAYVNNENIPVKKDKKAIVSPEKPSQTVLLASSEKNTNLNSSTFKIKPINVNKKAVNAKKGDTNLILLIILCFLWWLNLIAVYLHDGDITLNFWITLILDLTFIGGVIFSLLVVLDVVNLA